MKNIRLLIIAVVLSACNIWAKKVLMITHSYSRPIFIEWQKATFDKFLNDDYEFVVFNDATDLNICHEIFTTCEKLGIQCIRIPQEIHTRPYLSRQPDDYVQAVHIRHANCVQYSLDILGFDHDGIVFVIDSDMFLIRPLSISEYMADKEIAAFIKRAPSGIYCLCPALCLLSMDRLPNKRTLQLSKCSLNMVPM
jgi:hypothetical protein